MSFNYEGDGIPIALIKSDDKNRLVYYSEEDDGEKEIVLKNNETFQYVPNKNRTSIYIAGKNGSGKSYWISDFLTQYIKQNPKHRIYMFSEKDRDEQLDKFKQIKRIDLEKVLETPITYADLVEIAQETGVLCLFDDVDTLTGRLKTYIYTLIKKILKVGRADKVNIICSNHEVTNGEETKAQLKESMCVTWFKRNYNIQIQNLVKKYCNMTKKDITRWRKSKSRAVSYIDLYPNPCVLTEKEIFILNTDLD